MQTAVPLACFLSIIRPPGVQFENALLQISPVDKSKCPFVRDTNDIGFQLFTRHNPTVYQELVVGDDERLFASNFDFNDNTVLVFHAFMEQPDDGSSIMIREAYMQRGDTNVILVDAQRLEAGPWYFTAAQNTWYIGRFAAQFIDYMVSRGLNLNNTHLVGHSLGAQSAGVAGSALKSGRVARITGLDPALPLFDGLPIEQRLDPTDAHFVDVIHTDAGIFGYKIPVGNIDFYPNGGQSPQPGCELEVVIPQQLLLNKCKERTTLGYYIFYLTGYKTPHNHKDESKTNVTGSKYSENHVRSKIIDENIDMHSDIKEFKNTAEEIKANSDINANTKAKKQTKLNDDRINEARSQSRSQLEPNVDNSDEPKINYTTNSNFGNDHDKTKLKSTIISDKIEIKNILNTKNLNLEPKQATQKQQQQIQQELKTAQKSQIITRHKRSLPFQRSSDQNLLFRILNFLIKNRKGVLPVITVMREINTLVKSSNGELGHFLKETGSYLGETPVFSPISYTLELGNESKTIAFLKKLLGLSPKGDRLTITSN